jgi:tyrosine-protein phosphatase SIW14
LVHLNRHVIPYVAALTLTLGLGTYPAPAVAGERAATVASSTALDNIRIDNFGRVNDRYYRGAQPKGHDFADLSALGVKMVIDLASEGDSAEEANAKAAGMRFTRIPMSTHAVPTPAVIGQFLALVNDPANQPVYVHCVGGRHRTGVMTAAYRMSEDGWTSDQAFKEMKQFKFGADFLHSEFKDFVYDYEPQRAGAAQRAATSSAPHR